MKLLQTLQLRVICYFDPITDICIGAALPDGEQQWLAGGSMCKSVVSGEYRLVLQPYPTWRNSSPDYSKVFYDFQVSPLGLSAEQLRPHAMRR